MQKIFLILVLTTLMSAGANAAGNKINRTQQQQSTPSTLKSSANITIFADRELRPKKDNNLSDSFMDAFGMKVETNSGDADPSLGGDVSRGSAAVGMSTISTISINQVTPSFTPYSYKK